jgi:hypothetical protein
MASATTKATKKASKRARKLAKCTGGGASERASELAGRVKDSDALQAATGRGSTLVDAAKGRWEDSDLDQRAAELAERLREVEATRNALDRARQTSQKSLGSVGTWLGSGPLASKLGVTRRRKWPFVVASVIGVGVGFALAQLVQRGSTDTIRDELADAADRLSVGGGSAAVLADTIRTTLDADPRTAQLEPLDINVSDGGTVFVRGTVPEDIDQGAIRDVIASVPGVTDVDLQLSTTASNA